MSGRRHLARLLGACALAGALLFAAAPRSADGARGVGGSPGTAPFAPQPPPSAPGRALLDTVLRGDVHSAVVLEESFTTLGDCEMRRPIYTCLQLQKQAMLAAAEAAAPTTAAATTTVATTSTVATTTAAPTTTVAETTTVTTTTATATTTTGTRTTRSTTTMMTTLTATASRKSRDGHREAHESASGFLHSTSNTTDARKEKRSLPTGQRHDYPASHDQPDASPDRRKANRSGLAAAKAARDDRERSPGGTTTTTGPEAAAESGAPASGGEDRGAAQGGEGPGARTEEARPSSCHTAAEGEPCWNHVDWAMTRGIHAHPDRYPGLTESSSRESFQAAVHEQSAARCPLPCNPKMNTEKAKHHNYQKWGPLKLWDEEEKFHHVTERDFSCSCLLFGALVFDMVILYMVNWQDPHVRSYIYKMISATISIFLGVLLNQTIFAVFLQNEGFGLNLGPLTQPVFGVILFTVAFICVNVFAYMSSYNKQRLHAVVVLGGHIIAFAGITLFGNLQVFLYPKLNWIAGTVPVALMTLLLFSTVSKLVRTKMFGRYEFEHSNDGGAFGNSNTEGGARGGYSQVPLSENAPETGIQEDEWRECVCEAEDEAAVLILSFLASQALILWLTDELMPLEGVANEESDTQVAKLGAIALGCAVLLVITSVWRSTMPTVTDLGNIRDPTSLYMRTVRGLQNFWGSCMSWCMLRAGEWVLHHWLTDHSLLRMVNAILMTGVAVVLILVLDALADWLRPSQDRKSSYTRQTDLKPRWSPNDTQRPQLYRGQSSALGTQFFDDKPLKDRVDELQMDVKDRLNEVHETTLSLSNLERAVRTLINGMGLLVGMCWEKAFDSSNQTIIHHAEIMREHVVLAETLMALLTLLLVLPAWLRFIAPSASKHWREHMQMMEMEQMHAALLNGSEAMAHFISISKTLSDDELAVALGDLLDRRMEVKEVILQEHLRRSMVSQKVLGSVWETSPS